MHPESHESWAYHVETFCDSFISCVWETLRTAVLPQLLETGTSCIFLLPVRLCCQPSAQLCVGIFTGTSWGAAELMSSTLVLCPSTKSSHFVSQWCLVEVAVPHQVLLVTDMMVELLHAKNLLQNCMYWHPVAEEGIQLFAAVCIPWVCSTGIQLLLLKE